MGDKVLSKFVNKVCHPRYPEGVMIETKWLFIITSLTKTPEFHNFLKIQDVEGPVLNCRGSTLNVWLLK